MFIDINFVKEAILNSPIILAPYKDDLDFEKCHVCRRSQNLRAVNTPKTRITIASHKSHQTVQRCVYIEYKTGHRESSMRSVTIDTVLTVSNFFVHPVVLEYILEFNSIERSSPFLLLVETMINSPGRIRDHRLM